MAAGRIGPDSDTNGKANALKLDFTTPAPDQLHPPVFRVRYPMRAEISWTYDEITRAGAPPSVLLKEVLSTLPDHPKPGQTCPPIGLQLNFIDGGLILCFATHHTLFDGRTANLFFETFAANTRAMASPGDRAQQADGCMLESRKATAEHLSDISREYTLEEAQSLPEYDFSPTQAQEAGTSSESSCARILVFDAREVVKLKAAVTAQLSASGYARHVSTTDCLGGLIWTAVVRARQERLPAETTLKFAVGADARSRLGPPLSPDYVGNAVVHTMATTMLSDMLSGDLDVTVHPVALAAFRIREAVEAVDEKYVRQRLALYGNLTDPTGVVRAFRKAIDMSTTGLDFSDWRDQGADIDWGIPGTKLWSC